MRLIDADRLLDKIEAYPGLSSKPEPHIIIELIAEAPTAYHSGGRWHQSLNGYRCTSCEETSSRAYAFCPNCGARMEEGGICEIN